MFELFLACCCRCKGVSFLFFLFLLLCGCQVVTDEIPDKYYKSYCLDRSNRCRTCFASRFNSTINKTHFEAQICPLGLARCITPWKS